MMSGIPEAANTDNPGLCAVTVTQAVGLMDIVYGRANRASAGAGRGVLIVSKGGEIRWLIDRRALRALDLVWRDWTPYSFMSRIAWLFVRLAAKVGLLSLLPNVKQFARPEAMPASWIEQAPELRGYAPIVFVGKPSVTAKLTVFMAAAEGSIAAVVKLPLTRAAAQSIFVEAEAIAKLEGNVEGVPKLLSLNREQGISVQSWLPGKPVSRKLTQEQIDFLLKLPRGEGVHSLRDATDTVIESLRAEHQEVARHYVSFFPQDDNLPIVWEHGDFVPWNMKHRGEGGVFLIDWEYSAQQGFPLLDLCHFFYRQEYLFRDMGSVRRELESNARVAVYRKYFDLDTETCKALQLHYLIRCLRMDIPNTAHSETYQQFLHRSMRELIADE